MAEKGLIYRLANGPQAKKVVQEYWNELFEAYGIEGKPPKAIKLAKPTETHCMVTHPHVLTEYNGVRFYTTLCTVTIGPVLTVEKLEGHDDFFANKIVDTKTFKDLMQRLN